MSSVTLVALLFAAVVPDVADALYFVAGICSPSGLYSHTLHAVILQAAILSGAALLATGSRATALALAILVLLHVPADLMTGQKLLVPGGELIGLHLYTRPLIDFLLEAPVAMVGWWLLRQSGRGPKWATSWLVIGLVVLLQTGFDVVAANRGVGVKPNACTKASATIHAAVLVGVR